METLKRLLLLLPLLLLCAVSADDQVLSAVPLFNGMPIVNDTTSFWSGSDMGAKLNSAYTYLPANGGIIYVTPPVAGGCYNFSTPVTFTTSNKAVRLIGLGPSNQTAQGACLNYTPTTATSAISVDYMTSSGSAYAAQAGFEGITLTNNGCTTNGGCGSSATGIQIGIASGGNAGMLLGEIKNCTIRGFGTGVNFANTSGSSWGVTFLDTTVAWNTTGVSATAAELIKWIGGAIANNGTGITGPFDLGITDASIDSNTVFGIGNTSGSGMTLNATLIHFENLGVSSTHFISGNINGTVSDSEALNDNASGNSDYIFTSTGLALNFDNVSVASPNQTLTQIFLASTVGAQGFVRFLPNFAATTVGGANTPVITDLSVGIQSTTFPIKFGRTSVQAAGFMSTGTTFTASGCSNSTLTGGATAGSYKSVAAGSCTITITMGNSLSSANGWVCDAHDLTTPADTANITLGTTNATTAALVEGTVVANDIISFKCVGF